MSALAMILMAGVVVEDVPKQDVGEVEERLDLRGRWEGTWKDDEGKVWKAMLEGQVLIGCAGDFERQCIHFSISADKEKPGNLHINWSDVVFFQGIYEQHGDRIRI